MTDGQAMQFLNTHAYGWRMERRDGVTLGFTSHDRDVWIEGLRYRASPGMRPSSIVQAEGLEIGGLDVAGAIDDAAITESDLKAGRWNRAALKIFLFDWQNPLLHQQLLASGELGGISYSENGFTAEFFGPATLLDRSAVPKTSPSCRASFCGKLCGLNVRRFQHFGSAVSANGDRLIVAGASQFASDIFAFGQLRWTTGPNAGLLFDIISNNADEFWLATEIPFAVDEGDRFIIIEGCDKTIGTCSSRFNNGPNFRGEPYLPGNDILTRYPGG